MVSKPKIWKRKGKLTKKAKSYLSFKLKAYHKRKKGIQAEEHRPQVKSSTKIRLWVKFSYTGSNPLFIEAYIEGLYSQSQQMKKILIDTIEQNFGDEVASGAEMGFESIERISNFSGRDLMIRYKHSLGSPWRYLR